MKPEDTIEVRENNNPFVSRGGTSLICAWSLFAFIKSVSFNIGDVKPYRGRRGKG